MQVYPILVQYLCNTSVILLRTNIYYKCSIFCDNKRKIYHFPFSSIFQRTTSWHDNFVADWHKATNVIYKPPMNTCYSMHNVPHSNEYSFITLRVSVIAPSTTVAHIIGWLPGQLPDSHQYLSSVWSVRVRNQIFLPLLLWSGHHHLFCSTKLTDKYLVTCKCQV